MKIYYVDGYNVINSWPDLKEDKDVSFEGARQNLIDKLHNFSSYNNCLVNLVFDAHKVQGSIEKEEKCSENLAVIFTKDGETADAYIEKKVHSIGRRFEVYVVTSDSLEQQTIFQRGATRISSLEFYSDVMKVEDKITEKTNKIKASTKNNVWDNLDGDVLKKLEEMRKS
ncbi:NYN domain-containing protein [Clostridium sp. LY3-2]|uniref:NYN domain-containing protein n=1 Tax=Clostridium sp. LY3-2 TaxID=2942482 RepID=UPI002152C7C0|nr:NYN domain-containing protein [Clostridium sp. LY3-2]MCR6516269.1 NYN domain-containing protein [Clostridium sp. LY3-2]